jgi:predicted dehydrogenase
MTSLALSKGANVLCEKPLAATIQHARQMAATEREVRGFVAVGYQWSFSDAVQALKHDVLAGEFGQPRVLKTKVLWPRRASYYSRNGWAGRLKSSRGHWVLDSPANNATAHYLHKMFYILGELRETSDWPVDVEAELYRANAIENYDAAAIRCHTATGAEILFYTAHSVPLKVGPTSRYEFENAVVEYTPADRSGFVARFSDGRVKTYGDPNETYSNKLWHSAEAVRTDAPIACGIEAATPHTLCVNGAQESMWEIAEFPKELARTEWQDGDSLTWVEGLQQTLEHCYDLGVIPSELGGIPWARKGRLVDLRRYRFFPASGHKQTEHGRESTLLDTTQ